MLMKLCGFSRVPHNFFFIKKHIRYFIYHFLEIILMIVNGTSLHVFQVRVDTITFPFYYECNFFLLSIYLFSEYFSGIFFFTFFVRAFYPLALSITDLYIYFYVYPSKANLTVDGAVTEKWKYHNRYSMELRYWFAVHCFPS